ncbi:MAG: hypothetical protein EA401_08905 [Planctomycetota bacterium]|nr:MAG: hypothetical protein EA401_08905 [Planctomycetota bacterium]
MAIELLCGDGKHDDRRVSLREDKAMRVRCPDAHGQVVMLVLRSAGDACAVTVEGEGVAELDGIAVQEGTLAAGQVLQVGRHQFCVFDEAMSRHHGKPCTSCMSIFTLADCRQGWMEGQFRICRTCCSKGITPQHLPQWRHSLEVDDDDDANGTQEVASTDAFATTDFQPQSQPTLGTGAITPTYPDIDDVIDDAEDAEDTQPLDVATTPSPTPRRQRSDSEGRSQRRISASSPATTSAPPPSSGGGLIGKVTRVFRRRGGGGDGDQDERRRLQDLQARRDELLLAAGRNALTQQGGLGLPEGFLAQLSSHGKVALSLDQCDRSALKEWREWQRELAHLDAEVMAIRQALGEDEEEATSSSSRPKVTLRTEAQDMENRAFMASDALLTEDLGDYGRDAAAGQEPETEDYQREAQAASPDKGEKRGLGRSSGNLAAKRNARRRRR